MTKRRAPGSDRSARQRRKNLTDRSDPTDPTDDSSFDQSPKKWETANILAATPESAFALVAATATFAPFKLPRLFTTVSFCDNFIDKRSRIVDQMVQAARSVRQNIAEGSRASATSSQTGLRLVSVAVQASTNSSSTTKTFCASAVTRSGQKIHLIRFAFVQLLATMPLPILNGWDLILLKS